MRQLTSYRQLTHQDKLLYITLQTLNALIKGHAENQNEFSEANGVACLQQVLTHKGHIENLTVTAVKTVRYIV